MELNEDVTKFMQRAKGMFDQLTALQNLVPDDDLV